MGSSRLALGILTSNILNQLLRDSKSFYAMIKVSIFVISLRHKEIINLELGIRRI